MKLKENFVLRQVADNWVALPLGQEALDFTGILSLNDSGAMLWRCLEKGGDPESLADALMAEYNVDRATAMADAEEFIRKLSQTGCLETE